MIRVSHGKLRGTLIPVLFVAVIFILLFSIKANALPISPYFKYVNVSNYPIDYAAGFENYFVVISNGKIYKVDENSVSVLPYGKPITYLRQVCSAGAAGLDGAALYVAGTYEVGVITGKGGNLSIWGFSTYSKPILSSLGYDCYKNILWVVDKSGNLYISSPSWDKIIVVGPDGPQNISLTEEIKSLLSNLTSELVSSYINKSYPGAVLIGSNFTGRFWIKGAGITYRVSPYAWFEDSSLVPVNITGEFLANITTSSGINRTLLINLSIATLINLQEFKIANVLTNISGYLILSLRLGESYGLMLDILGSEASTKVIMYKFTTSGLQEIFEAQMPNAINYLDVVATYDALRELPAMVINDGKDLFYYVAKNDSKNWLVWSKEPFRGLDIKGLSLWENYIAVINDRKINLLSLSTGTPLWALYEGVDMGVHIISIASGSKLVVTLENGEVMVADKPGNLSRLKIVVNVNGKHVGSGFPVIIKSSSYEIKALTINGEVIAYVPYDSWQVKGDDAILGPLSLSVQVRKPLTNLELNYTISNSYYKLIKGKDPLGFLEEGPALGSQVFLITPWGSKVRLNVLNDGELALATVPGYLEGLFSALPLRPGVKYTINASLSGYENLIKEIEAGNGTLTLNPILDEVLVNVIDYYTGGGVKAQIQISKDNHVATVTVPGTTKLLLPPGTYIIRSSASGYYENVTTLNVNKTKVSVYIFMRRTLASLTITTLDADFNIPINSTIFLNGPINANYFVEGTTSIEIPWGTYKITVTAPNYVNYTGTLSLKPGEKAVNVVRLIPKTYSIYLYVRDPYNLSPISFKAYAYVYIPSIGTFLYKELSSKGFSRFVLRSDTSYIVILSEGYQNYTIFSPKAGVTYNIFMKRLEYNITIVVVDEETRRPVTSTIFLKGPIEVSTKGSGAVLTLPWGTYSLSAKASGYETYTSTIKIPQDRSVVVMLKPAKYQLTVIARDSYTGSLVNFTIIARPPPPYLPIITTGYGKTSLELRKGIQYNIFISSPGYVPKSQTINLTTSEIMYVDLVREKVPVEIVVTDADTGMPLSNATVTIFNLITATNVTLRTDSNGKVLLQQVWGTLIVKVFERNYLAYETKVRILPGAKGSNLIKVNLVPVRHLLDLYVFDKETSLPISNAIVIVKNLALGTSFNITGSKNSLYIRQGTYLLIAKAPGYESNSILVNLTKYTRIDIYLSPMKRGLIISAVDSETDKSLPFTLSIYNSKGALVLSKKSSGNSVNVTLRVGSYILVVSSPNYMTYRSEVNVTPGNKPLSLVIKLKTIRVPVKIVVVNEKGNVVNAYVEVRKPVGIVKVMSNTTLELPIGYSYVIRAWAPGYLPSVKEVIVNKPMTVLITIGPKRLPAKFYLTIGILVTAALIAGATWAWIRRRSEKELEEQLHRLMEEG